MHAARRLLVRVTDAHTGQDTWVEAEPEVAALLRAKEPRLKERLLRRPKMLESLAERQARALAAYWGGPGEPWEGPRFGFDLLLGESPTWDGPGKDRVWFWKVAPDLGVRPDPASLVIPDDGPIYHTRWWLVEHATGTTLSDRSLDRRELRALLNFVLSQDSGALGGLRELRCRYCGHLAKLDGSTLCLGCDRTGRDRAIRPPSEGDLARRAEARKVYAPAAGLKGGKG